MKTHFILVMVIVLLSGCSTKEDVKNENSELISQIEALSKENKLLKEKIETLQFPATDRLANIRTLISENKFNEGRTEIDKLKELFPLSDEAKEAEKELEIIKKKEEAIKAEEARIKALGFKILKEENNVSIDYNKISIGSFSTAQTFTFNSYDSRYFYRTADRGNKYISARISITSTDKDPLLPMFWAYSIAGEELILIDYFTLEFARWKDYGSYLGNYHDNGNDFSKTATIPFKIGLELSDETLQAPMVILLKKENCMTRSYERFNNPPVSYLGGGCTSPKTLTIEEVKQNYAVVKILNKNKI